jgi:hypothetical protein
LPGLRLLAPQATPRFLFYWGRHFDYFLDLPSRYIMAPALQYYTRIYYDDITILLTLLTS